MVRSRIALAALSLSTLIPGVALAAPSATASTSCKGVPCETCGIPFGDLDRGPFAHRDYIAGVEPYRVTVTDGKHSWSTLEGAVVKLRPAPGA